ncbi:MAG TPA: PucR family transcriptional regulator ligand-binding domain-containing protein [Gaiellaceae bacterium]|nr:PucR family transcriptional regulator ligand-binding domain-containing protein [Gaiellaceae bacterium]
MLSVRDIATLPGLDLRVAAGAEGLSREVSWLHVSELDDPTQWLEGGELLLTTGLGVGEGDTQQRAYVRRLAEHGLAGLGFGVGFNFAEVPGVLAEEADALGFPVLEVPYEVPFVAITKTAVSHLASERLEQLTQAIAVHERLADAVLKGRGLNDLLGIVCGHLDCSLQLVDEGGGLVSERHSGRRIPFDGALELPVVAREELAMLRAVRDGRPFGEYDRLVLHHGQTALAFELSRRRAVSAAELRLAGDLLEDLEDDRLDERESSRRMAAFGLDPRRSYAALLAQSSEGSTAEAVRQRLAGELDALAVPYVSTARLDRAAFLVEADADEAVLALAQRLAGNAVDRRLGIGRPARGRELGRSLLEARAALDTTDGSIASYRDLGSLELLLNLDDAPLEAFVDRVLGPAARNPWLLDSLAGLLDAGCRWSEAAERLGVHRHTLRYRMDRLREVTGRHPDDPEQRMELWLALKAHDALDARRGTATT